jgi:hypothetical protein
VAHIITYGVMASKSALADVGRIQSVPLSEVNDIKKLIPDKFPDDIKDKKGKTPKVNLHNCYEYVPELKQLVHGDRDDLKTMLHYAEELEDTIRQTGIHACGVIIGADDLTNFAPLATIKDRATDKDIIVTQYDGHVVESVGLIKMDFLGLRTLTIIKETLKNIAHSKGREAVPDIDEGVDDDCPKVSLYHKDMIEELTSEWFIPKWEKRVKTVIAGKQWLDCVSPKSGKGTAVAFLQKHLGIAPEETIVFGDNFNDIEMFDYGHSYVVASARDEVKKAADEVCPPMPEDGVLQVLKNI